MRGGCLHDVPRVIYVILLSQFEMYASELRNSPKESYFSGIYSTVASCGRLDFRYNEVVRSRIEIA